MLAIPENVIDTEAIEAGDTTASQQAVGVLRDALNGLLSRPSMGKWEPYDVIWSSQSGGTGSIGNGTLTGRFSVVGDILFYAITLVWGGTTSSPHATAGWTFTLPLPVRKVMMVEGTFIDASVPTPRSLVGAREDSTTNTINARTPGGVDGPLRTTTITWASGDTVHLQGFAEIVRQ